MELKELLGDDLFSQVDAKIQEHNAGITDKSKHVHYVDLGEGGHVLKGKYDSKVSELADTKKLLDDANNEIQSYKDMDIDGIKQKAADWETKYNTDIAALNQKITDQQKESAAKDYLQGKGIKSKLAQKAALTGLMGLEFKDGALVGADDYLKKLKEEDPDSFETEDEGKSKPQNWVRSTTGRKNRPMTSSESEAYLKAKYGNNKYYRRGK